MHANKKFKSVKTSHKVRSGAIYFYTRLILHEIFYGERYIIEMLCCHWSSIRFLQIINASYSRKILISFRKYPVMSQSLTNLKIELPTYNLGTNMYEGCLKCNVYFTISKKALIFVSNSEILQTILRR